MKVKTPMFHWGQGTMFKALAGLLLKREELAGTLGRTDIEEGVAK
jgi:hypothetical protein